MVLSDELRTAIKAGDSQETLRKIENILIDDVFKDGATPLIASILYNQIDITSLLIQKKASVSQCCVVKIDAEYVGEVGCRTPKCKPVTPLQAAVDTMNAEATVLLLSADAHPREVKNGLCGLLTSLIRWGRADLMKFVLDKFWDKDFNVFYHGDVTGMDLQPVVHTAVTLGNLSGVKTLLSAGLNPNSVINGVVPLMIAAQRSNLRMCRLLIDYGAYTGGPATHCSQFNAPNPLLFAVLRGWMNAVDFFVHMGFNINQIIEKRCFIYDSIIDVDCPLLQHVVAKADLKMVKMLLEKHGACVDMNRADGGTVLHTATEAQARDIIQYFLSTECAFKERIETFINKTNDAGLTPFMVSCQKNDIETVELFLAHNAVVDPATCYKGSPITFAIESGNCQLVEKLLRAGGKVNGDTKFPVRPLHVAASKGHIDIIKLLLDFRAEINAVTSYGETALHCGIKSKSAELVETLLDKGVDVHRYSKQGYQALHLAAMAGCEDIVGVLLKRGAHVNAATKRSEETPLLLALSCLHESCVHLLLSHGASTEKLLIEGNLKPEAGNLCRGRLKTLQLLAAVNYRFSKNWLDRWLISVSSELNFLMLVPSEPILEDFIRSLEDTREAILNCMRGNRTLRESSRVSIRRFISKHNPQVSIYTVVTNLPLPSILKQYIMLSDFN